MVSDAEIVKLAKQLRTTGVVGSDLDAKEMAKRILTPSKGEALSARMVTPHSGQMLENAVRAVKETMDDNYKSAFPETKPLVGENTPLKHLSEETKKEAERADEICKKTEEQVRELEEDFAPEHAEEKLDYPCAEEIKRDIEKTEDEIVQTEKELVEIECEEEKLEEEVREDIKEDINKEYMEQPEQEAPEQRQEHEQSSEQTLDQDEQHEEQSSEQIQEQLPEQTREKLAEQDEQQREQSPKQDEQRHDPPEEQKPARKENPHVDLSSMFNFGKK